MRKRGKSNREKEEFDKEKEDDGDRNKWMETTAMSDLHGVCNTHEGKEESWW